MKLLLVEDEYDLNLSLVKRLRAEQYTVDAAFDGEEALDYLAVSQYDAIICDIMMPNMNGHQLLKELRNQGDKTKLIFLTARDSLEDRVSGLDMGADDYLVKPFEFAELLARIRVQVRQKYQQTSNILEVGDLTLDSSKQLVMRAGEIIQLTAKEYQVLLYLMQNLNHTLSREQILNQVWDFDYEGESNIIDVIIKNIRKKLAEVNPEPVILTKRGLGYVIQAQED